MKDKTPPKYQIQDKTPASTESIPASQELLESIKRRDPQQEPRGSFPKLGGERGRYKRD